MDNLHRRWSLLLDREIEPATKALTHSRGKLVQVGGEQRCSTLSVHPTTVCSEVRMHVHRAACRCCSVVAVLRTYA